ncbi:Nif3-like dinuclear metal center hexameric protein, partial [bacterium]|nr:Nif3-like dinuclear metal center hexameric protein [bacterium]
QWKDYSCCTFKTEGKGSFKPGANANPFIGEKDSLSFVEEVKLECIIPSGKLAELIASVMKAHPYEEPAYDVYQLENKFEEGGIGRIGDLEEPLFLNDFLNFIKDKLNLINFRYIFKNNLFNSGKEIKKIAVVNGSINSIVEEIKDLDFDALVCGEVNYHNAQMLSEIGKLVIELGHGESELFAVSHIHEILSGLSNRMHLGLKILKSNNKELPWRYFIGR